MLMMEDEISLNFPTKGISQLFQDGSKIKLDTTLVDASNPKNPAEISPADFVFPQKTHFF